MPGADRARHRLLRLRGRAHPGVRRAGLGFPGDRWVAGRSGRRRRSSCSPASRGRGSPRWRAAWPLSPRVRCPRPTGPDRCEPDSSVPFTSARLATAAGSTPRSSPSRWPGNCPTATPPSRWRCCRTSLPRINVQQEVGQNWGRMVAVEIETLVVNAGPEDLFDRIVRTPLEALARDQLTAPVTILVDALDESLASQEAPRSPNSWPTPRDLPEAVRFIVTCRPRSELIRSLQRRSRRQYTLSPRRADTAGPPNEYAPYSGTCRTTSSECCGTGAVRPAGGGPGASAVRRRDPRQERGKLPLRPLPAADDARPARPDHARIDRGGARRAG